MVDDVASARQSRTLRPAAVHIAKPLSDTTAPGGSVEGACRLCAAQVVHSAGTAHLLQRHRLPRLELEHAAQVDLPGGE